MTKTLTFLHTSSVHIATFDRLLAELAPDVPIKHIVDEGLLQDARASGITAELSLRVRRVIDSAIGDGAAVIVCTCSTIGGCAESTKSADSQPILRIDRPMAEESVAIGSRIIIAAALASTLTPTRELLLDVATNAGKTVTVIDLLCEGAWIYFERGNYSAYLALISEYLHAAAPDADCIVLAQTSMAGAINIGPRLPIPILSSPRSGLEAALRAYRTVIKDIRNEKSK